MAASQEDRHLHDIIHAVHVLRQRGVPDENIYFYLDHPSASIELQKFNIIKNVKSIDRFNTDVPNLKEYEILFLTVTGHGSKSGLIGAGANPVTLTAHAIFSTIRAVKSLKGACVAFCQCYAGIFNFADVSIPPEICVLGATALHNSLSSLIRPPAPIPDTAGKDPLTAWGANVFMYYFFRWLATPNDTDGDGDGDGDGTLSIVDAYKYAGVESNEWLRNRKSILSMTSNDWLDSKILILKDPKVHDVTKEAVFREMESKLQIFHLHQEPWILHPAMGRSILF